MLDFYLKYTDNDINSVKEIFIRKFSKISYFEMDQYLGKHTLHATSISLMLF